MWKDVKLRNCKIRCFIREFCILIFYLIKIKNTISTFYFKTINNYSVFYFENAFKTVILRKSGYLPVKFLDYNYYIFNYNYKKFLLNLFMVFYIKQFCAYFYISSTIYLHCRLVKMHLYLNNCKN